MEFHRFEDKVPPWNTAWQQQMFVSTKAQLPMLPRVDISERVDVSGVDCINTLLLQVD